MSDKEEFEKFILYGIEGEILFKKCIENEIVLVLFFLLAYAVEIISERRNYVFLAVCVLPAIFYLISVITLGKGKRIAGIQYILQNGILVGGFSLLFGAIGFEILLCLFGGKERIIMICIAGIGYIFAIVLWGITIKQLIKKKKYSQQKGGTGTVSLWALGGSIIGVTVGRSFLKNVDNGTAMGIICMLFFFVSYLSLIGIVNIFKYQYIVKHPEMFEAAKSTNEGM